MFTLNLITLRDSWPGLFICPSLETLNLKVGAVVFSSRLSFFIQGHKIGMVPRYRGYNTVYAINGIKTTQIVLMVVFETIGVGMISLGSGVQEIRRGK